jgi:hypothetical protein
MLIVTQANSKSVDGRSSHGVNLPSSRKRSLRLAIAVGLVLFAGCHKPGYATTDVEGIVTVDGAAPPKGGVTFTPLEKNHGRGVFAPIEAGHYQARQVALGPTRVTFTLNKETGGTVQFYGTPNPEIVDAVPPKYRQGVEIDVQAGDTKRDFSLDSK